MQYMHCHPSAPSLLCLTDDTSYHVLDNKLHRLAMWADSGDGICHMCVFVTVFLLCVC